MTSIISSSKWVVFKAALKRLKWFGILYAVALFLQLPLFLWLELSRQKALSGVNWTEIIEKGFQPQLIFHPVAHLTNIAAAIIFGLIIFTYLHKDRANTFFHSLPIKRSILYLQNLLAGFVLLWLPLLLNGILIFAVLNIFGISQGQWYTPQLYHGYGMEMIQENAVATASLWKIMAFWFFLNFLMTGLILIFTVFIGMLTGNVLLQGTLSFIGLFLPLGLYLLVKYNLWKLLYGYPRDLYGFKIEWLSPLVSYVANDHRQNLFGNFSWYIIYLAIAIILGGLSIALYKKRHAEAAGETLAAEWIRQLFKYGVALCAAMTGGLYLSSMNEESIFVLYLGYFLGALLGYSISDMIAYKSFHFYKRWKGMVVFGAAFVLLVTSVNLDIYGYEKHVPEQAQVERVSISNFGGDIYSYGTPNEDVVNSGLAQEANIEKVRQLHEEIISRRKQNEAAEQSMRSINMEIASKPLIRLASIRFDYLLQNGDRIQRAYTVDINEYRDILYALFQSEEVKKKMYRGFFQMNLAKVDQINIDNHHLGRNVRVYKRTEIKEAMAALEKDLANISYEAAIEGKVPSRGSIEFVTKPDKAQPYYGPYNLSYFTEFKHFEEFLQKYGYLEQLVLDPAEVEQVIIKKVGSSDTLEVVDKEQIKVLLDLCYREDENAFRIKEQRMEKVQGNEFYGKFVLKKGNPMYVSFALDPDQQQPIFEFFDNKK